ncbi:MAG: chemotaxis protein CheA [Bacillota bacterium]
MNGYKGIPREYFDAYFIEMDEHLQKAEEALTALLSAPTDKELVNQVFRAMHNIKGSSAAMYFDQVRDMAHEMEDLLDEVRTGKTVLDTEFTDRLIETNDRLSRMISDLQRDFEQKTIDMPAAEGAPDVQNGAGAPSADAALEDKSNGAQLSEDASREEGDGRQEENSNLFVADTSLPDTSPGSLKESEETRYKAPEAKADSTLRVSSTRLDELMAVCLELSVAKGKLVKTLPLLEEKITDPTANAKINQAVMEAAKLTEKLQGKLLRIRMLPIKQLFRRYPKLVRELSRELGKEIEMVLEGEDTELDKVILEGMADPLTHLIRNAVDHGIESPEERTRAGKPLKGKVFLRALTSGNQIVIEVEDDGRGLDLPKIREKAEQTGLLSAEQNISEQDTIQLIFQSGFTTAEQVTELSGRGVGMDVVGKNIAKLNGMIDVKTVSGKGTRISITLPLTTAISKSLVVNCGGNNLALPLDMVLETRRIPAADIKKVGDKEFMHLRGIPLPLIRLKDFLNLADDSVPQEGKAVPVVVIGLAERRFGLVADEIVGQQELMLRPVKHAMLAKPGINGASILDEGEPVFLLEIEKIIEMAWPKNLHFTTGTLSSNIKF